MKRATVIAAGALIVTTSLTGCGPNESEAAPIRRENDTPARPTAAVPVESEPATQDARILEVISDGSPERQRPLEEVRRDSSLAEDAAPGEIGIVPRDALIDVGAEILERRTLLDGKLSLLVPRSFTEMGPVMLQVKYPSQNRPSLVLTNESGAINVAINYTSNRVKQKDLPAAFNVIRAQLRNAYPTAQWYAS